MITKYIGSIEDFKDCYYVGFCQVKSGIVLSIDNLDQYTEDNDKVFNKIDVVTKTTILNENGSYIDAFVMYYDYEIADKFYLNALIMYNTYKRPIGFVDLSQNIDIGKYRIKSVTVNFDYDINNQSINLIIDDNYISHLIATKNKTAHNRLFNPELNQYKASSKSEIISNISHDKKFTKNIRDIVRDNKLLYRYSGNIHKHDIKDQFLLGNYEFSIALDELRVNDVELNIVNIIDINENPYVVAWSRDYTKLISMTDGNIVNLNFKIDHPYYIGSNMIIETNYTKIQGKITQYRYIHNTKDIVNISNRLDNQFISNGLDDYPIKSLVLPEHVKISKNPFTNELMLYYIIDNEIHYLSNDLALYVSDFGSPKFDNQHIIYAAKGYLLIGTRSGYCYTISNIGIHRFNNPGYIKAGKLLTNNYQNINKDLVLTDINQVNEVLDSLELDFITPISQDLHYIIHKGKQYLLENHIDNENQGIVACHFKLYDFIGHFRYKNLAFVAKNYDNDITRMQVSNFAYQGNLYKVVKTSQVYRLSRL